MRVNMIKTSKDKEHYLLKIFSFQNLSVDMTDHAFGYSPFITCVSTARIILVVMNYSLVILKHFDLFGRTVKNQTQFLKRKGFLFKIKRLEEMN